MHIHSRAADPLQKPSREPFIQQSLRLRSKQSNQTESFRSSSRAFFHNQAIAQERSFSTTGPNNRRNFGCLSLKPAGAHPIEPPCRCLQPLRTTRNDPRQGRLRNFCGDDGLNPPGGSATDKASPRPFSLPRQFQRCIACSACGKAPQPDPGRWNGRAQRVRNRVKDKRGKNSAWEACHRRSLPAIFDPGVPTGRGRARQSASGHDPVLELWAEPRFRHSAGNPAGR